ncbi:MAG: nicotinate-nicotinamide nucleotide adenylyltransferase [Alphaproteobacteria bacterium]|nr:nicotinate-nicotinamide nucleotide adenylyltransferase [Alphaproteobacteria bacterium]
MTLFSPPRLLDGPRWKNMRIGLLGGSFDPPHEGHVYISLAALKGLQLDAVWWLVSPQNPLKSTKPMPLDRRMALCRDMVDHPKILISDIETEMGTSITYDSIRKIKNHYPTTDFVWISGMDNALGLHRWHFWKELLAEICMVHLTRNPARSLVKSCPYRMYARQKHVFIDKGGAMPLTPGTTYWMMQKKMVNISSTEIRSGQRKATKKAVLVAS